MPEIPRNFPEVKKKTAGNPVVIVFGLVEVRGVELLFVCLATDKVSANSGLFTPYESNRPPFGDKTSPKSSPKVRSIISAAFFDSPSTICP